MPNVNAQMILDKIGVPVGGTIPLPFGLTLEISAETDLDFLCDNHNEKVALKGLLGVCQSVVLTLSGLMVVDIASLVMLVNPKLGAIFFVRDRGIAEVIGDINPNLSIEEFINNCVIESGLFDAIQEELPDIPLQLVEFEEIIPLWWKIVNSKLIYVLRDNYTVTNYSSALGLDGVAAQFFNTGVL